MERADTLSHSRPLTDFIISRLRASLLLDYDIPYLHHCHLYINVASLMGIDAYSFFWFTLAIPETPPAYTFEIDSRRCFLIASPWVESRRQIHDARIARIADAAVEEFASLSGSEKYDSAISLLSFEVVYGTGGGSNARDWIARIAGSLHGTISEYPGVREGFWLPMSSDPCNSMWSQIWFKKRQALSPIVDVLQAFLVGIERLDAGITQTFRTTTDFRRASLIERVDILTRRF
jgi:hypothetical protein